MSTISERITILMKDMGTNQKQFAELTKVDTAIICRILSGKCEPTIMNLQKIAEATKTSPNWLLGYGNDDVIERM